MCAAAGIYGAVLPTLSSSSLLWIVLENLSHNFYSDTKE